MGDREGHDSLLDHLRQRVGHLRPPALPGPEHLKAMPVDLALPGVIGGAVHPERSARCRDVRPRCLREKLLAVAEQHVILGHQAQPLSSLGGEGGSLSRGTDGFPDRGTRPNLKDLSSPQLSGAPGDSPPLECLTKCGCGPGRIMGQARRGRRIVTVVVLRRDPRTKPRAVRRAASGRARILLGALRHVSQVVVLLHKPPKGSLDPFSGWVRKARRSSLGHNALCSGHGALYSATTRSTQSHDTLYSEPRHALLRATTRSTQPRRSQCLHGRHSERRTDSRRRLCATPTVSDGSVQKRYPPSPQAGSWSLRYVSRSPPDHVEPRRASSP